MARHEPPLDLHRLQLAWGVPVPGASSSTRAAMIAACRIDSRDYLWPMNPGAIVSDGDDVVVRVVVVPNASASKIVGLHGDRIKIRVAAPPERGRANSAVCKMLRDATGASRAVIEAGMTNRSKTVRLVGVSERDVVESLSPHV